jgi:Ca2+-binding EF-hand superfamily protein
VSAQSALGRSTVHRAFIVLLLLVLGGCGLFRGERPEPRTKPTIYSPNGEPLNGGALGQPSCQDAMTRWLARVDTDHDGTIDHGEFLADARRQFAAMDLNRDGIITPSVLAQYRAPFSSEPPARSTDREADDERRERSRSRGIFGGGGTEDDPDRQDRPDPVMLADVGLRNQVTRDDFLAYARHNFASLDTNHDDHLDKTELLALCTPPP